MGALFTDQIAGKGRREKDGAGAKEFTPADRVRAAHTKAEQDRAGAKEITVADVVRAADFSTDITIGKSYVRPVLVMAVGLLMVWLGAFVLVDITREGISSDLVLIWLACLFVLLLGSLMAASCFTILFFTDCFLEITDEGVRWHRLDQDIVPWSAFIKFEVLSTYSEMMDMKVGIKVEFNQLRQLDSRWPYWQLRLSRKRKRMVDINTYDLAASNSFMVDALNAGLDRYRAGIRAKT